MVFRYLPVISLPAVTRYYYARSARSLRIFGGCTSLERGVLSADFRHHPAFHALSLWILPDVPVIPAVSLPAVTRYYYARSVRSLRVFVGHLGLSACLRACSRASRHAAFHDCYLRVFTVCVGHSGADPTTAVLSASGASCLVYPNFHRDVDNADCLPSASRCTRSFVRVSSK